MAKRANGVTPIRRQYLDIKRQYPDAIVLFRLGDFYETFDADAETAARELDIVLTSRNVAKGARVPMAGIPYHAVENYLARLIDKGYHVAICEQVGNEPVNGLVPRKVVRVVTPGTVVEPGLLASDRNNYLAAAIALERRSGFAYVDITTGSFHAAQFDGEDARQQVHNEIARLRPAEVLLPASAEGLIPGDAAHPTELPDWNFEEAANREALCQQFAVGTLAGFGIEGRPLAIRAAGAILRYLQDTQPATLDLLVGLSSYTTDEFMVLDPATRRNLELEETMRDGQKAGSLLGVLDYSATPMGGRLLREWINRPLLDKAAIDERLDGTEALLADDVLRAAIREDLKQLADLERLTNRVLGRSAGPHDLAAIRATLRLIPKLRKTLAHTRLDDERLLAALNASATQIGPCTDTQHLLEEALADDPPPKFDTPGVIRSGWSPELDGIMEASRAAREWIQGLEPAERRRTGIKSLKVGYNKVFGYYIEVTKSNTAQVPDAYIRKQTLVNAERYITPELKEYETLVLNAEEEITSVERRLFAEVCARVAAQAPQLLETARAIARLDALASFAEAASRHGYVRPEISEDDQLRIVAGRHPVVEKFLPGGTRFVPNDIVFAPTERVRTITGPNMSGKSTYLRQAAVIVLMAQIGSFVPAESAQVGLVDRIFTRIGAQDEIHAGQSTFMVEMVEAANILNHATARS
ncbi:MAG: DNA mismatch repair protein MutS, partial [Anaerolineales bacterium]